nr:MAG TPA: hypothetical protein [Caudoviricetes sp.]
MGLETYPLPFKVKRGGRNTAPPASLTPRFACERGCSAKWDGQSKKKR